MTTRKIEAWEGDSPFGDTYYDSVTVLAFLAEHSPDKGSTHQFVKLAYQAKINCWIMDFITGKRHAVEYHHWYHGTAEGVNEPEFSWSPVTGWGKLFDPKGRIDIDDYLNNRHVGGIVETPIAQGNVYVDKAEVVSLLSQNPPDAAIATEDTPPSSTKAQITASYQAVKEWYSDRYKNWPEGKKQPSRDDDTAAYKEHFNKEITPRDFLLPDQRQPGTRL